MVKLTPDQRSTRFQFREKRRRGIFAGHTELRKGHYIYVVDGGSKIIQSSGVRFLGDPLPDDHVDEIPLILSSDTISNPTNCDPQEHSRPHDAPLGDNAVEEAPNLAERRWSRRIARQNPGVALIALGEIINEPLTVTEARQSPYWPQWKVAIHEEIEALRSNGTFNSVHPPAGAHVVGSSIKFWLKRDENGNVDRFKARVCAQGFSQRFLVHYDETYSPVARIASMRVFLALVTERFMRVSQGDVRTAYVIARLNNTIFVRQPNGFEEDDPTKVWKLLKTLYGLRQATTN